jgi:hypothetical protein
LGQDKEGDYPAKTGDGQALWNCAYFHVRGFVWVFSPAELPDRNWDFAENRPLASASINRGVGRFQKTSTSQPVTHGLRREWARRRSENDLGGHLAMRPLPAKPDKLFWEKGEMGKK